MSAPRAMNPTPRRRLREIVGQHGHELVGDPKRTKALLMDLCGEHTLEINLLGMAQEERVAADLLQVTSGTPKAMLLDQLTRRLQERRGLTADSARWAVESWALALGVVTTADLRPPTPQSASNSTRASATRRTPQPNTNTAMPDARSSRGDALGTVVTGALAAGPRAFDAVRFVTRTFKTLRHTTRALSEADFSRLPRATILALGSALTGALIWAIGGAGGGAFFGVLFAATSDGVGVSLTQSAMDWLVIGASVAALLGALTGALIGVIRYFGETGGTLLGAGAGLALGIVVGPMSGTSFFQVGMLIGALFAIVSLGMISGQGKNVFGLITQAMGMVGASLRKRAGWVDVGKGALWGGLGSLIALVPLALIGLRGTPLTAGVGWLVGMIAGAVIGEKYKWLRLL